MNVHRKTRIAAAVAALAAALPAVAAEEAATQPTELHRVIVTGSNIKRIDVETSDPVTIIRRSDIERSGASTVVDLLKSLPWTTESLSDKDSVNRFASGASSTSLRHMGAQSTLVLLNGRRLAPFALVDFKDYFTNLDALPLNAIERIEILKNGASAIYGSDAVAGVINVITREDYQGFEFGANTQKSLNSRSFGETGIHATAGVGNMQADGFNLTASLEHYHRERVMWRDVMDDAPKSWRERLPSAQDQLSIYSSPGNLSRFDRSDWHAVAGCDANSLSDGLCWYDRYKDMEVQPAADRTSLLVSFKAALTPDVTAFGEFIGTRTKTSYRLDRLTYGSADSAVVWVNSTTTELQAFHSFALPATHPLNDMGEDAVLAYRFADVNPQQNTRSQNYRLITGLRGNTNGYDWETALTFARSTTAQMRHGSEFSRNGFSRMIGGTTDLSDPASPVDPDFFNQPGGYRIGQQNSPEVLNALFPRLGSRGKLTQATVDGKISGQLGDLPAGPVSFATGYDLRHERSVITPTDNVSSGDIVGYVAGQTDGARTYGAVFGEIIVPVTQKLESQLAARVDKFPGFGAHLSPKVGLRFQPTKDLLLRATAESGFRAPNLTEAAPSTQVAFSGTTDPLRCPGAQAYANDLRAEADSLPASDPRRGELRATADQAVTNECSAAVAETIKHNPALKPEVSRGYSLGLLFEPLQDMSVSLDYWSLQRKNEIGLRSTSEVVGETGALPPGTSVNRAPLDNDPTFTSAQLQQQYGITAGSLIGVTRQFENTTRTRTDGIDIGAKTRFGTPVGSLELNLLGTWLNRFQRYSTATGGYGDNLAGHYGYSRWSANLSAALTTGAFVNGVKLTYRSSTKLQDDSSDAVWSTQGCADNFGLAASQCRVGSYVRTDYFVAYSGIRNVTLGAYVSNLFNRTTPFDRKAFYYAGEQTPAVEDVKGRTLRLALDYKFF
ncbi:TonB-dependent receptor domain-containing protein [Methylibium rhizosphaerae]|uniref:TonB-dependent receptor domain-containing protein n=1 Tax=Methylibium rhizosphaerae TaxID=2570323 RepID=UPI0015E47A76|nr:TonB-dependent receptor [Methylibium rhizosphaerae]